MNIRKEFENYGNIESVNLLDNNKPEAYVTFFDDKSAAMAYGLMNCENDLKITEREYLCFKKYIVHIANTWHQPPEDAINACYAESSTDADDDNLPPILNLNEDCLRQIFSFCDIDSLINLMQTCKAFNDLLCVESGATTFRQFTTLQLIVDVIEKDRFGKLMTVGKARRLLRHVGPFVKKLILKKLDEANAQRYFEKIAQYVGDNLREMEIYDIRLTGNLISALLPIFNRLTELKIRIIKSDGYEIDFEQICPNLEKFKVAGIMNIEQSCKHWPQLQYVSLLSDIISAESFCAFILLNAHLRGVKFFYHSVQQIQSIANNLTIVEKLEINCKYKQISAIQLGKLSHLSRLTQLTLWNLISQASVVDLLLILKKFNGLRVLKLQISDHDEPLDSNVCELTQQTIAALTHNLVHLEKVLLVNINLNESTVHDIVRSTSQLKSLHIHDVHSQWNLSLITGIVNIRKSQQQKHLLKLYLDSNLNVALTKDDHKYLRIYYNKDFGCRHDKIKCYRK